MTYTTKTKHKHNCKRAFSNYDMTCPRCKELSEGLPARDGWNSRKDREYANFVNRLENHDCKKSGCGPICTFGDN